jgi:23S rRNA (guanosine2251-2'-O)-methyltransferase
MKLYGKNPVLERIKADPGTIRSLYLQKRTDLSEVVKEAKKAGIVFKSVDKAWFLDRCGDVHAQGVMAEVAEFSYASFSQVLSDCLNGAVTPVFLDGVTDPQNLGAIIRNLACLGGFVIVLPEYGSAHVTEAVLRVANGGENYIKVAKVTNIATAVKKAREEGIWIGGAVVDGKDILETEFVFPMAAVIGSEGKGVRPGVKKCIDAAVSLPMRGAPLSYNVAVATALFCYEVFRRKAQSG